MRLGAEKYLAIRDGRRRIASFTQVIRRQEFELLGVGPEHSRDASSAGDIEPPGGEHHRAPALASFQSRGPQDFTGLALHALRSARTGIDDIDPPIDDHTRTDPLWLFFQPKSVRRGHVAGAAQLEADGR